MKTRGLTQMALVLATLPAYPMFTYHIFFSLPDSSVQYSWSLELCFRKTKSGHGFCQIWRRLDVLELNLTPRATPPSAHHQSAGPPSVIVYLLVLHMTSTVHHHEVFCMKFGKFVRATVHAREWSLYCTRD